MSFDEGKKAFIIKHTFTNVKNMEKGVHHYGNEKKHFNIPWNIVMYLKPSTSKMYISLSCRKPRGDDEWSINVSTRAKVATMNGLKLLENNQIFANKGERGWLVRTESMEDYLIDNNLTVEFHVTINKITGIDDPILRNYNDDLAKEFSDVVLKVKDQKFYVLKKYLAVHSTYFSSLFCGNFNESMQSEIELKDIDSYDFQKFLEALYGELIVNENNIEGILQLADMYDARTVIRQCEDFLICKSDKNLKFKFSLALKYNMDQLKKKCISELKSVEDIENIVPEDRTYLNKETSNQLLDLSFALYKKN